jgi:hypothetical protein
VIPGVLLLAIAAIGAAYGGLVIRAAPKRRDNVVFGALALSDALMITWRAINVLTGESIVSESVTVPCSLGTMVMAFLTIEFLHAFPGRPPMRWHWRAILLVWTASAALYIALASSTAAERFRITEMTFYGPATALVFVLAWRARKETQERAARVVIGMLCFRWGFGFLAYALGPAYGFFEEALWAETTFATLLSFVIIGTAVLRKELFSIRSAAAEVTLASTMALAVVLGGGGSILGVLHWIEPGNLQTCTLASRQTSSPASTSDARSGSVSSADHSRSSPPTRSPKPAVESARSEKVQVSRGRPRHSYRRRSQRPCAAASRSGMSTCRVRASRCPHSAPTRRSSAHSSSKAA